MPFYSMSDPTRADETPSATLTPPIAVQSGRWLRPGVAAPVPRQRRMVARVFIALTSSSALLGVAALAAAAAIVPPIGARREARSAAEREVRALIGADEQLVATAFASQRRWTDLWRESFGVLVATDKRLLYVGAPPKPLLRPRDDGPDELLVESYPYDAAFILEPRTIIRKWGRGLVLRTPVAEVDFIVSADEWRNALAVSQASAAARREVTRSVEALAAATRPPPPPAEEYTTYVVRRGETLTALARRFHTSPDVLQQLNQLTSDDIRAGQRLRVPLVRAMSASDSVR